MAVQLIIDGNHVTDILTQIRQLSDALSGATRCEDQPREAGHPYGDTDKIFRAQQEVAEPNEAVNVMEKEIEKFEIPDRLTRGEHEKEANKMIEAGEINIAIYPLLTKVHQKRVAEAIMNKGRTEEAPVEQPSENLFAEPVFEEEEITVVEPVVEPDGTITFDGIRDLLVQKCRNSEGKDDPAKYAAAIKEIKRFVPEGAEAKVGNVPEGKLKELYYALSVI